VSRGDASGGNGSAWRLHGFARNPLCLSSMMRRQVWTWNRILIQQALTELMAGRTTFVIAQRLRTLNRLTRFGARRRYVVQRGTHDELVAQSALSPYYDLQLRTRRIFARCHA